MSSNNPVIFIEDDILYLRPVERGDCERNRRWVNSQGVFRNIMLLFPVDDIGQEKWHENRDRSRPPIDMVFAIVLKKGNIHIGNMGLHRIDWVNRLATTGAIIGEPEHRGRGYAHRAKMLLLGYAFNTLGLRRIESAALATNEASLRCLAKSGYVEEGRRRGRMFRGGEWVDEVILAVMADDWRALRAKQG
jgi:RimJ/RimL family protein N-acetyltransferase